jgi:hypothetical protein
VTYATYRKTCYFAYSCLLIMNPDFSLKYYNRLNAVRIAFFLYYTTSLSTLILQNFVKFRNSNTNVLKIVLIIVNINKHENKSLISNQFSLKNESAPISWRTILRR